MFQHAYFKRINFRRTSLVLLAFGSILLATALLNHQAVFASPAQVDNPPTSPLHPTFEILDEAGQNVLLSGKPVSTMKTCGTCHDTDFIEQHSYHAWVGLDEMFSPGQKDGFREWDTSTGYFGKWNPLFYRYLTPPGDERLDLSTAEWIMTQGIRHVGGGPAVRDRNQASLLNLSPSASNPEASILDARTGQAVPWNWSESGVVEMNCFLCHIPEPNAAARAQALRDGLFRWANTATLLGSGLVEQQGATYTWNAEAFDKDGKLKSEYVTIQDPTNENCGLCHGLVHDDLQDPLLTTGCKPDQYRTQTSGQIISPQRMADSGMNLANKVSLDRSWDIHAERQVTCTDCHFSLNNPVYYQADANSQPDYLTFDPRRLELGEYLYQPLHQFARGQSAQSTVAPELKGTMRSCESCHSIENTHDWLPYKESHVRALSCETCHVQKIYSTAYQQFDWTVVRTDGHASTACRGVEGESGSLKALIKGFEPVILPRKNIDGNVQLAPYNLITSWFWVYGEPARPVRQIDLMAAWLVGDEYAPEVLALFDQDGDGELNPVELRIDTPEKETLISNRLQALGLDNPRIVGEVQPYSINHTVAAGNWATKDCRACHTNDSRLTQPFTLASYVPGNVMPEFVLSTNTQASGDILLLENGELIYQPDTSQEGVYIFGHNAVAWVDLLGSLFFMGTLLGITAHGGLRFYTSLKRPRHTPELKTVYMYTVYERLWHWLQTFTIILLLFTGLIIHKPATFGIFSYSGVVIVHNILAVILLVNAALSLFYHLVSGEIRQYIPRPYGFMDQAIQQALYYLRGIFKGAEHPFEKTPEKKLNPLQQVTYFGILNVLLPLQVVTGALMWGVQHWPDVAARLGGLPFLAPFHSLIAWLFASFIVGHVYLTTTGHEPLAAIKAMMMGWDEVEVYHPVEETVEA